MHRLRSAASLVFGPAAGALRLIGSVVGAVARRLPRPGRRAADLAGLTPALLAGAGVFLVVAGLFDYFNPVATPSPTPLAPFATPVGFTLPPRVTPSGRPSPSSSGGTGAIATRLVIPAMNIDVPIIAPPPNEQFPLCDTAEYLDQGTAYAFPGAPQATYLYAHARVGMFWPLLVNSRVNDGAAMVGMWVEVYTSDNQRHIYQISEVIRHVPNSPTFLRRAQSATTDQLWLQTSEGHADTSNKLQVVADPVGVVAAVNPADAHPASTARVCPDAPVCTAANQGGCRRG